MVDALGYDRLHGRGHLNRGEGAGETVGPRRSDERLRLYERSNALLEKERVTCCPFRQQALQRLKRDIVSQQGVEHVLRAVRLEWANSYLGVIALGLPLVPVLGAVVHEQQHPGRGQALD